MKLYYHLCLFRFSSAAARARRLREHRRPLQRDAPLAVAEVGVFRSCLLDPLDFEPNFMDQSINQDYWTVCNSTPIFPRILDTNLCKGVCVNPNLMSDWLPGSLPSSPPSRPAPSCSTWGAATASTSGPGQTAFRWGWVPFHLLGSNIDWLGCPDYMLTSSQRMKVRGRGLANATSRYRMTLTGGSNLKVCCIGEYVWQSLYCL